MRPLPLLAAFLLAMTAAPALGVAPIAHRELKFEGTVAHVLTVPAGVKVVPVAERPGKTVAAYAQEAGATAAINGGYFNHSDGWPVSFVRADGQALGDPKSNRALTGNPALKPHLAAIFDARVEWRAYEGAGWQLWAIAPHSAPALAGYRLRHALQAGPALLPVMDLQQEAFVLKDAQGRVTRDGIGTAAKAARSAIGITPRGELLLVAVAGSPKAKTGVTIPQLQALMRTLGAQSAMALDGGSSTTMSWREGDRLRTFVGSGEGPARVNSALVVLP